MDTTIELSNGRVWYDEHGDGPRLLMLHGGAVDSRFFDAMLPGLTRHLRVLRTDLWGHGRTPDREGRFSYDAFAADVAELIERVGDGPVHLLGHSIGAAVAMTVAMQRPDLVDRLVIASSGYDRRAEGADDEVSEDAVTQTVAFLGSTYGEVSPDGEEHFAVVVRKDFELSTREPEYTAEQVGRIEARTLVMLADDDILPLEHAVETYRAIPNSELAVVPGTSHFLFQEKPELCTRVVTDFLTSDPVPTVAPIRRAPSETASVG